MKVSVIVPVFNPGEDIDACVASLLGQTMPADDAELIFVDDGSTDGTPAKLDALAAAHPNVRVQHIPNSGWPGKPRNVGLDLARGEYVYFVDNDDWLAPDALERLYDCARTDRADVVIGKVVGRGRVVGRTPFEANRHGVTLTPPLLALLSPHKLFRRRFVDEHGIRFPEGHRRLEDHLFVVPALLAAERISVLADHPIYYWVQREDRVTASSQRFEPEAYYGSVREVLDIVERAVPPGPERDALTAHWYRSKMLNRVGGRDWLSRSAAWRRELYEAVRSVALERYTEAVHEHLTYALRVRSQLLRAGDFEGLEVLSRFERRLDPELRLKRTDRGGTHVVLHLEARLGATQDSRARLRLVREGDGIAWLPPDRLQEHVPEAWRAVGRDVRRSTVAVSMRSLQDGAEYTLPARTSVRLEDGAQPGRVRPRLVVTVPIAPTAAAAGGPLPPGRWEVLAHISLCGFTASAPVLRYDEPLILTTYAPGRIVVGTEIPPPPRRAVRVYRRLPGGAHRAIRLARARAGAAGRRRARPARA